MEALVQGIAFTMPRYYKVVARSETDVMLKWKDPMEIQELPIHHMKRVAAIGDGNCLLHSFLFATSPTYRSHTNTVREFMAAAFRDQLIARQEEIAVRADVFYANAGGAVVIAEALEDLPIKRKELSIEIAPILGQLFGYNLLAVRLDGAGILHPVGLTMRQFDATLPTVVIHYVGGGANFGEDEFRSDGHYEPIVMTAVAARSSSSPRATSGKRKTAKKPKVKLIQLPVDTLYDFPPGSAALGPIIALFRAA